MPEDNEGLSVPTDTLATGTARITEYSVDHVALEGESSGYKLTLKLDGELDGNGSSSNTSITAPERWPLVSRSASAS